MEAAACGRDLAAAAVAAFADLVRGATVTWPPTGTTAARSLGAALFGCRWRHLRPPARQPGPARRHRKYGAEVREVEGNYDDACATPRHAQACGWTVVSDTSYPGYRDIRST